MSKKVGFTVEGQKIQEGVQIYSVIKVIPYQVRNQGNKVNITLFSPFFLKRGQAELHTPLIKLVSKKHQHGHATLRQHDTDMLKRQIQKNTMRRHGWDTTVNKQVFLSLHIEYTQTSYIRAQDTPP